MKQYTKSRLFSFKYAITGLVYVIKTQRNAWIHLAATVLVILSGFMLRIQISDWLWLALAIAIVWAAEIINTAIETIVDLVSPEFNPIAKIVKDCAAAAVLVLSGFSVIAGIIVLYPYLFR